MIPTTMMKFRRLFELCEITGEVVLHSESVLIFFGLVRSLLLYSELTRI